MITWIFPQQENVTEQLKAENQLEGVRRMNNIRNRANYSTGVTIQ